MNQISRYFARWSALSRTDQRTVLVAGAGMPIFWLGLRVLGLPRFQAILECRLVGCSRSMPLAKIQAMGELVNIAARHTLGPRTCLTRSLLLGWLLQRRGVMSQLRIGVRLRQGALEAHAWVEYEGIPVNDRLDVSTQFASFGDLIPLKSFQAS